MVTKLGVRRAAHSVVPMNALQNSAFQQLLTAWRRREDARASGSYADLGAARKSLESARSNMHTALHSTVR